MDPISALSVACAVFQFADLGAKILTKGRELYQSHSGALERHAELEKCAEQLSALVNEYSKGANALPEALGKGMEDIIDECNLTAGLLSSLLNGLKIPEKSKGILRVFRAGRQAVRTAVRQSQIDELNDKMMDLREKLQAYMLAVLQNQSSSTQETLKKLSSDSAQRENNIASQLNDMRREMLSILQKPDSSLFLASDLEKLVPVLSNLVDESRAVTCKTEILSSLYFPEMKERYDQIRDSEYSFEWILGSGRCNDTSVPRVYFVDWLHSQKANDNTYWISGKPGSGKSTLMKFLYNHDQTRAILKEWAGQQKLVISGFYFWISGGSRLLKSQLGLLRSLVFEVFWHMPEVIEYACPERYAKGLKPMQYGSLAWTLNELLEALKRATTNAQSNTRFCFFIDGLDECDGYPQAMVDLIRDRFPKSPDIKFCLASRKWNAFIDEYGDVLGEREIPRHLYLEDLTQTDIRRYVQRRLQAQRRFQQWHRGDPVSSKRLIEDVVKKAEGVFLWVTLVVESLIRGVQNKDHLATLQDRLDKIPSELPDYFAHMLRNVEDIYKVDAAKIYQIMLNTTEQPYLLLFSYLWERDPQFGTVMETKPFSLRDINGMNDDLRVRLNARCTDLLDIVKDSRVHIMWESKVAFLHRTVRDYMRSAEAQEILGKWLSQSKAHTSFNPDAYICQSAVAHIKRAPRKPQYLSEQGRVSQLVNQFAYAARRIQKSLGDPQIELMNSLETTLNDYRQSQRLHATTYHTSFWYSKASFLQWAEKEQLDLYVSYRLSKDPAGEEDLNEPRLLRRRQTFDEPEPKNNRTKSQRRM
ncbi:hypothetical protein BDQ94DRAFT_175329 [Aspergillus welwitschiae]|uniref:NACHT domain-containing protein n=1 Tax=Aspergillus welwitschiae TaxID=1341132 RepID=A0A3F3PLD5_9EURO|nr:hypothetical protein BDQ94DRAFT_175329 [Aspergillus welwitschiae]RDH27741.1 hypothetical protein BDQ94DRAFT_175329 [Aspergillus welwitschiae]